MKKNMLPKRPWQQIFSVFFKTQPRRLLLGCLLSCLTAIMGCMLLGLSGWFIAATAIAGVSATTALLFDVFMPSAGIRLLALSKTASRYGERLTTHDATLGILNTLREKLFTGWAQPDAAKSLFLRPSRILFRLTNDLSALESLYLRLFVPMTTAFITTIVVGIMLSFINGRLGLGFILWVIITGIVILCWISKHSALHAAKRTQMLEKLRAQTIDLVAGQTDLIMVNQLAQQQARVAQTDLRLCAIDLQLNRIDLAGNALLTAVQTITLSGAIVIAALFLQQEIITIPVAVLLILLTWAGTEPLSALRRGALEIGQTWLAAKRLAPRLTSEDALDTIAKPAVGPIVASDITYTYDANTDHAFTALSHLHFSIQEGEHVAIIGTSGSGKSTLLSLLAQELTLQQGKLSVPDVVWLTQRNELFQDSVRNNINLQQQAISDDAIWASLAAAGLVHDIQQSSDGLNTQLGEKGLGLSGGQSRRLALARLFISPCQCWLLDEPTEGIDAATAQDILQRIKENAQQKTIVLATHLYREASIADRLIVLDQGKIVTDVQKNSSEFDQTLQQLRLG